jgi:hypothetical protein
MGMKKTRVQYTTTRAAGEMMGSTWDIIILAPTKA